MKMLSVIKNLGPGNILFWKVLEEDFNTGTRLIVNPGEQAVFIRNGIVHGIFENGDYALTTQNYPFLSALRNSITGGESPFNCRVYFVRTADSLNLSWGTATPLQVRDPRWDISVRVRGNGSYVLRITNPGVFLSKYVGANRPLITFDEFRREFRSEALQYISACVANALSTANEEVLVSKNDLPSLAETTKQAFSPIVERYGVSLVRFNIAELAIDDQDPNYAELQKLRNMRNQKRLAALGNVDEIDLLGNRWKQVQSRDIMKGMVENPGLAGGAVGIGAGLGMGVAAGGLMGTMLRGLNASVACNVCHSDIPEDSQFCPQCGTRRVVGAAPATQCDKCGSTIPKGSARATSQRNT